MKKTVFIITFIALFGSSAFSYFPELTCEGDDRCRGLRNLVAAGAIMTIPGSAEAIIEDREFTRKDSRTRAFKKGALYSLCQYENKKRASGLGCDKYRNSGGIVYEGVWSKGKEAGNIVWNLFESEGVSISYIQDGYYIDKRLDIIMPTYENINNDNISMSPEEIIKNAIRNAKKMIEEGNRKYNDDVATLRAAEKAREAEFQAKHSQRLTDIKNEIYNKIYAASKTPKGRLEAARQIMCKSIRDYHDQTLDLTNPSGAIDREYKYNASRDVFFTMLESSGKGKYNKYSEDRDNYNRYCR